MVESTTNKEVSDKNMYLWIITDKDYEKLRTIEGCQDLKDLGTTKTDAVNIINFAKGLGIPDENIFRNESATAEEIKETYKKILVMTRKLSMNEE